MGIIFDFIEKLQKKPEPWRKKFVFFATLAMTSVIIGIWLTLFVLPQKNLAEIKKTPTPFTSLKQDILNFYGAFKEKFR